MDDSKKSENTYIIENRHMAVPQPCGIKAVTGTDACNYPLSERRIRKRLKGCPCGDCTVFTHEPNA